MPALAALLNVSQATVYGWFNRWERGGLSGRASAKSQGRPVILQAADRERVEAAVRANRRFASGTAQKLLRADAFFKKDGSKWRRFRHRLKTAQDPDDYQFKAD